MNEKFYNLSKDKQDVIINAAIKVFAQNGYEHASTDTMIKEAGISKGLLFHYFGNKKNLYQYVLEYSARYLMMELSQCIHADEKNFFDRVISVEKNKIRMLQNYRFLDLFLLNCETEQEEEVKDCAKKWSDEIKECYQKIWEGSDIALLRGNLALADAVGIVTLCMNGYKINKYRECQEPEEVLTSFLPWLQILKTNMTR